MIIYGLGFLHNDLSSAVQRGSEKKLIMEWKNHGDIKLDGIVLNFCLFNVLLFHVLLIP